MQEILEIENVINTICLKYSDLSKECKTDLINCAEVLTFGKKELLVKEGEFSDKIFFIIEGAVRSYYIKEEKTISDWFAFENDFISAISSFFLNVPSTHFIEMLEPTRLLVINRNDFQSLGEKHHSFERLARVIITKTMLQMQYRIISIQFKSAQERYDNILNLKPDIILRVPLTYIATFLGITLETLSRIRKPKKRI